MTSTASNLSDHSQSYTRHHAHIRLITKAAANSVLARPAAKSRAINTRPTQNHCAPFYVIITWFYIIEKEFTIQNKRANSHGSKGAGARASKRPEAISNHDHRVTQYWEEVCGYIRHRFGAGPPDPEEVVQTAFVKILAKSDISSIDNPRAFLYTAAYNTAVDMTRSQNRLNQLKATSERDNWANLDLNDITPERVLLSKENFQIALETIKDMPDVERETLILYRIRGLTLVEIAAHLGKSKTSVIRYLASAMQRLVEAVRAFENAQ